MKFEEKIKNIFPKEYQNIKEKFESSNFNNLEDFFFYSIQETFLFKNINNSIDEEKKLELINYLKKHK